MRATPYCSPCLLLPNGFESAVLWGACWKPGATQPPRHHLGPRAFCVTGHLCSAQAPFRLKAALSQFLVGHSLQMSCPHLSSLPLRNFVIFPYRLPTGSCSPVLLSPRGTNSETKQAFQGTEKFRCFKEYLCQAKNPFCKVNKSLSLDFSLGFFVVVVRIFLKSGGCPLH